MTVSIIKQEGLRGLYRGMSASYLGVSEGVIQWVLYEVSRHSPTADLLIKTCLLREVRS